MLGLTMALATAFAKDCDRVPLEDVALPTAGAAGMAIRDVVGALEIVGDDGDTVRASGSACAAGATVRLASKEGVLVLTVKAPRELEGLALKVLVPRSLAALTVEGQVGQVRVEALPARLAVVNGVGDVAVRGGGSLRIAYTTGSVSADAIAGTLILDHVVGRVDAREVHGDVIAEGVTGEVAIAEVEGDLVVEGGSAAVRHSGVQGHVRLP